MHLSKLPVVPNTPHRGLERATWLILVFLGAFHAYAGRHYVNPDGVSYLDVADAYRRHDWNAALNAYWSPLYSWVLLPMLSLLKPSAYWEASAVHVVNFAIFVAALAAFRFMLTEARRSIDVPWSPIWIAFAYTVFAWATLHLMSPRLVTPDGLAAALTYLAAAMLLRLRRTSNVASAAWLGAVLGFGYLAKAALLPVTFVVIGALLFSDRTRKGILHATIVLATFVLVSGPFITAISAQKGRPTFSDAGKLNYLWFVADVMPWGPWNGEPPGTGLPEHPVRAISNSPPAYGFTAPFVATYPFWYDPSYWYDGARMPLNVGGIVNRIAIELLRVGGYLLPFASLLALFALTDGRREMLGAVRSVQAVLLPLLAALALYVMLLAEGRYVAPFLAVPLILIPMVLPIRSLPSAKRVVGAVLGVCVVMSWAYMAMDTLAAARGRTRTHIHMAIARDLKAAGILPGGRVAMIGDSFASYWARLAQVRIVAEVRSEDADKFWSADRVAQQRVLDTFARLGVTAVIADDVPENEMGQGWRPIEGDKHSFLLLH